MAERLTVSLGELRAVTERLLAYLLSSQGGEVLLEKDFFWSIPPEQLYNVLHLLLRVE